MCGFSGFNKTNNHQDQSIRQMTRLLEHRGPDDQGFFIDNNIALGHQRLSIIDLTGGKQPMMTQRYVIVFNGEIYNYCQLRKQLQNKGLRFKTNSDTEVLLKMYQTYGPKCLGQLNGMFAFVIWDKKLRKLFAARDRLGIKPFYYSQVKNKVIFASEIKSILAHPDFHKKLNQSVLNSYFQYRYIIGPETFFENIYSLLPGHYLKYNPKNNKLTIKQYWHLPITSQKKDRGESYYLEQTQRKLIQSVKERLISDVPFGAYLSGGLDSSVVTALMSQLHQSPIKTFSIGFNQKQFNELTYARLVARHIGTQHRQITLRADKYLNTLESLINYKDAPLAVPNEVPLYLMSRALKKYFTVVLSGEGADELFGGYGRIFRSYLDFEQSDKKNFLDFFLDRYNYVSNQEVNLFLSKSLLKKIKSRQYTYLIFKTYFDRIKSLPLEDQIPYIFQNLHLQGLLQRVDTCTMAASVEGRVPFVDHQLVEFVNRIPFKYKIKWKNQAAQKKALQQNLLSHQISENLDIPKYLIKKAFANYLPQQIIQRKKIGFPVPLDNWLKGPYRNFVQKILLDKLTLERGIFDKNYLLSQKFFKQLSGLNLWMMINLELFLRKYFD